jgi:hypothetical protein
MTIVSIDRQGLKVGISLVSLSAALLAVLLKDRGEVTSHT